MVLLSYTQLSIDLHLNLEFFTVSLKNVGYLILSQLKCDDSKLRLDVNKLRLLYVLNPFYFCHIFAITLLLSFIL